LRFAITAEPLAAAKLLELGRDLTSRPPSLDARRLATAASLLDLPVATGDALAESLSEQSRAGDPISAAAKAAALTFAAFPDAPAADAEILALGLRLRWPRPLSLIATRILDPTSRSREGGCLRPGDPAWPNAAASAIALAAASAVDLAR
jgi:Protein of unknown function (DUF1403)